LRESIEETMERAERLLSELFGFAGFRPMQREIIEQIVRGRDALVVMPTGGGKSLCYQLPALLSDGLTLVVSPLISLMKDQADQLASHGVGVACLNSAMSHEEYDRHYRAVKRGEARLLYVAPEALSRPQMTALLDAVGVDCLAIDEAHCISHWGHDFRPDYRKIEQLRQRYPEAVCVALTATANKRVREDIIENLQLRDAVAFLSSFDRPNLHIEVTPRFDAVAQSVEVIERFAREVAYVEFGGDESDRAARLDEMRQLTYNDVAADRQVVAAVQALEAILQRQSQGEPDCVVRVNDANGGLVLYRPGVDRPQVLYEAPV